jgi:amino acid permease
VGADGLPTSIPDDIGPAEPTPLVEAEEEEEEEEQTAEVSIIQELRTRRFATIMICLNSLLGVGILGVASGFANAGLVPSTILLILMAGLSLIATFIVIILAKQQKVNGFSSLAFRLMGRWGSIILAILTLIFMVCSLIAYLILGSDMIGSWLKLGGVIGQGDFNGWKRKVVVVGYSLPLPIALSCPRNLSFLQYLSTATAFCTLFYIGSMVYKTISQCLSPAGLTTPVVVAKIDFNFFSAVAMFGLAFSFPPIVLPAIHSYNPLTRKRKIVTSWALGLVFVLVLISGFTGYFLFGREAKSNILQNFADDDTLIVIVRAGFFVIVTCVYPMVSQSVQSSWAQIFFGDDNAVALPAGKRILVLAVTNALPLAIALFLPEIKPVLEVSGALGGCLVDFVFPGILWIKHSDKPLTYYQNVLAMLLVAFGFVCGVLSTYMAVRSVIETFSK